MQPRIYRYYPASEAESFAPDLVNACLVHPGVRQVKDGSIEAPLNVAWLTESVIQSFGVGYKPWAPKQRVVKRPGSLAELIKWKGLRSHDPRTGIAMQDFVNAYQSREAFKFADHEGVLFQWPPGSGKSLGSILWSMLVDGRVVVVTGAKGRLQWRDAIRRFTTREPYICTGTSHLGAVELPLYEGPKTKGYRIGPEVRALVEDSTLTCSCGAAHRRSALSRGPRKLNLRVFLPPGHHELIVTINNVTSWPQAFDIEDPSIPDSAEFTVVGWETLPYHTDKLLALKPTTVIFDESHKGKNHRRVELVELSENEIASTPKAKQLEDGRWIKYVDLENIVSATQKLSRAAKRRAALTATPIKDRPRDLWAQLDYIVPWGFGKYWDFAKRYCGAVKNSWGGMDDRGMSNFDELMRRVSFFWSWVSTEESKANLPALRREVIYLSPDDQQREDESFVKELANAQAVKASVRTITSIRLAGACSRKRKAIVEQVVEEANAGAKVVIFTARHNDVDALKTIVPKRLAKNVRFFSGDGRDTADKRYAMSQEYLRVESHAVFIGTGQAFGEQIDLNETDIAHIIMLPFTWAEVIQQEGRFLRLGSTRRVLINYWVAEGTVDERVASILLSKLPAVEKMGTEGIAGMRAAFAGNEEDLLAALAKDIMAGSQDTIEGIAND